MEPKIYIDKQTPKTSGKSEEMSLCSCYECDTIRCFSTKEPTIRENDERYSRTCIYFTNITIKQSNSNPNTSISNIKPSESSNIKKSPSCEICIKEKEIKESKDNKNKKNSQSDGDTTNPVCKICNAVKQTVNNIIDQKLKQPNVGNDNQVQGCIRNTAVGKNSILSDLINKNELECLKGLINEINSNVMNKDHTSSNTGAKRKLECKICKQNIKKNNTSNEAGSRYSILDKTIANNSVCDVCLRNLYRLNNDVKIIFNKKNGLVSEVLRINNDLNKNNAKEPTCINTKGSKLTLAENQRTSKPKCLSDIQPKCSFCAIKYGVTSNENNKQDIQIKGDTKCKLNIQDSNAISLNGNTSNSKSPQLYTVNTVDNRSYPKKDNYYFKSKCKNCYSDIETNRKIDAVDYSTTKVPAYIIKLKGKNCENNYNIDVKNNIKTPKEIKLRCSNCGKEYETSHKTDRRCNSANNEVGANYSRNKEMDCHRFPKGKVISIQSGSSLTLCTCKSHEHFKKDKLEREFPVLNVHNATVNFSRNDINPSAAKLSAQIMNLPYEEFEESLTNKNQEKQDKDFILSSAKMKNNLSDEILKRIRDVYKACSCKICECIPGKSLELDNVCNCKPCDCDDCKSYKKVGFFAEFRDESEQSYKNTDTRLNYGILKNQYCDCKPCCCVKCMPPKTFIAARVSENRSANNCSCEACHCRDCERNFFSLSTHFTHDMSTGGMVRNCACDQCVDQRCNGAGGTEACRCEMPSKAICKPVEKETHDYDLRYASVHHTRCKKNLDTFNTIAMYASVSSNFPTLGTLKEACSCEECDCVACKHEDKILLKTILKPQIEPYKQCIRVNANCVCKSCQCEICSYSKNKPKYDITYQDKECTCGECYCISCEGIASSSRDIKLSNIGKPIGKIHYKNKYSYGSKECDDTEPGSNESLCAYRNKQDQHVCMNATFDKDFFINNRVKDHEYKFYSDKNHIYNYKEPEKCSFAKAFCNLQQSKDNQLASMYGENSHNNYFIQNKQTNKESNYFDYAEKDVDIDRRHNAPFQADIEEITNKYGNDTIKILENSDSSLFGTKNEISPFLLPTCKTNNSKSNLATCLKEVLTYNEDLNINTFHFMNDNLKTVYKAPTTSKCNDILSYGRKTDFLPCTHRDNVEMSAVNKECAKDYSNDFIWNGPLVISNKHNLPPNQIDYKSVHKTLKEAKEFSEQLIKLLEKYDRANKNFQSVSEKLKLSNGLNFINKLSKVNLEYVVIDEPSIDYDKNTLQNSETEVKNILNKTFSHHVSNDNLKDEVEQKKIQQEINECITDLSNQGDKMQNEPMNIKEKQSKKIPDSLSIKTKFNINNETTALKQRQIDGNGTQRSTDIENVFPKEKSFTEKGKDINKTCSTDLAMNNAEKPKVNAQNKIDNLTEQLSEIIKENVLKNFEEVQSRDVRKFDKIDDLDDGLKLQEKEVNDYVNWSISKKNYYLNNNPSLKDSFTSPLYQVYPRLEMQSMAIQTSIHKPGPKCNCEDLKVCSMSCRRVSDHTVMVKWLKPKVMNGVQGYELLVDGRPVQKIIDSARCMAVVTCLPNCDKVLLTMRTVLDIPLTSGHKPTVTIVYHPRLKKTKNEDAL